MTVEGREKEVVMIEEKGEVLNKYEEKNKRGRKRKGEVMKKTEQVEEEKMKESSGSASEMADVEKVEEKKVRRTGGSTAAKVSPRKWPVRERKVVELFSFPSRERELASKFIFIKDGKGMKLKDIPNVAYKLSKRKVDDKLQKLHIILFKKKSNKYNMKRNILQFSGFVWETNELKERAQLKQKIDKCVKECLLDFCKLLDIPVTSLAKKMELSAKLLEFLESPHATTEVSLAKKQQKRKRRARIVRCVTATSSEGAVAESSYEERTSDDVVPEEGNTELGKPANELEQHTLSNRISTEEHVQGSSAKQKAARCIENSSCKDVREEGEIKVHSNAKAEPSQQEMMAAISDMLAQADFDEETMGDILKGLEAYFDITLSHRETEIWRLIEEGIRNMDFEKEEEEEVEEEEEEEDSENDEEE
ncbi:hypothetical protein AAC387_Pa02g3852 [Persea americana]